MKSYQDHISSLLSGSPTNICYTSSAIFPFLHSEKVTMKLLFLNYWKLKRNLADITCTIKLRNHQGKKVYEKKIDIQKVSAYEINLKKLLGSLNLLKGSCEILFSSPSNLVFPFPAVTLCLQGEHSSSFVHSAQRVYSSLELETHSVKETYTESGFNIYCNKETSPFVSFINGSNPIYQQKIEISAINSLQQSISKMWNVNALPYETILLNFKDWEGLQSHLNNQAGCMRVKLFESFTYPRLIVGNIHLKTKQTSLTHTYYDLSKLDQVKEDWKQPEHWHAATLMLPVNLDEKSSSTVTFYPITSPSHFWIDLEFFDSGGTLLKTFSNCHQVDKEGSFRRLALTPYLKDLKQAASVRLIANSKNKSIPSRIKIGFDVGYREPEKGCNICTNFQVSNPKMEGKSSTFKWAPMLRDKEHGMITCHNSCSKIQYTKSANLTYTFYRLKDEKTLTYHASIPPHGTLKIKHNDTTRIFFEGSIGWCVLLSDNPFISTYYFSSNHQDSVGGDHGF